MATTESIKHAIDALEETMTWVRCAADTIVEAQGGEMHDGMPSWVNFHTHTIDAITEKTEALIAALYEEARNAKA